MTQTVANGFTYTSGEWAAIAAELPQDGDERASRERLEQASQGYIETEASLGFKGALPPGSVEEKKIRQKIAAASHRLELAIKELHRSVMPEASREYPGNAVLWLLKGEGTIVDPHDLMAFLPLLREKARISSPAARKGDDRGNRALEPWREHFYGTVLVVWLEAGGTIRDGEGPLMRFFQAAVGPALGQLGRPKPSIDAFRGFVRRVKAGGALVCSRNDYRRGANRAEK